MADFLLGLDYGTGGAKTVIIDTNGNVLGYAFEEYPILTPKPGWSEHDPVRYWDLACRIIKKAIADSKVNPSDIKGMAVSSALPSMVMVDENNNPINNAYNLMDRRATKQVQKIKDSIGDKEIFDISKNRLDDHPAIVNLMWEKDNRPDDFKKINKALTIDGFITLKLTGEATCHHSGAAFFGVAYNLLERRFDTNLLKKLGLSEDLFPRLCNSTEIVGEITEDSAKQTGLVAGIPVAGGQVDCNAGWIGAGAIGSGDIQMNLGTCGNFGIIHSKPIFHDSMIACNYTTDAPGNDVFITIPTTTTGGQCIRYLRDNFYVAEKKTEKETGIDTYDLINQEAEKVPAGSEGLVVLPYLMGERTPIWDVDARGAIFGLSLNHTRGHIARAMMEAVAYALYHSYSIIREAGEEINGPIVLNEGGAKSVLWRRIITDVFNIPTVLVKNRTGAPYGDAILAGVATGIFKDFSVAKEWAEYIDPMEPDPQTHKLYMEYFDLYKRLYNHVKDDYKILANLRNK